MTSEDIVGDEHKVSITYSGLTEDVMPGRKILIDDGLIELEVVRITENDIICKVINGGELGEKRGSMYRMYRYVFRLLQRKTERTLNSASARASILSQLPL